MGEKMQTTKERAVALLFHPERYPGLEGRASHEINLLLWRNESLGDFSTWTFFTTADKHYLRRIVWRQRTPYQLNDPNTYGSEVIISKETLGYVMDPLSKLIFNKFEVNDNGISLDGIGYGAIAHGQKIEWRNQLPPSLIAFGRWHDDTVSEVERFFSNSFEDI